MRLALGPDVRLTNGRPALDHLFAEYAEVQEIAGQTGGDSESAYAIAVDDSGDIFVAGTTDASGFPVTAGTFDPTYNAGASAQDAYVAKISGATRNILWPCVKLYIAG